MPSPWRHGRASAGLCPPREDASHESHAPRTPAAQPIRGAGKPPAARPHFSRPAAHSRDRKPAASASQRPSCPALASEAGLPRPAVRPRTQQRRRTRRQRHTNAPRPPTASATAHSNGSGAGNGSRSNGTRRRQRTSRAGQRRLANRKASRSGVEQAQRPWQRRQARRQVQRRRTQGSAGRARMRGRCARPSTAAASRL